MAAVRFCGDWLVCSGDSKLMVLHTSEDREVFELDCASLEKRPKKAEGESEDSSCSSEVLAVAVSASGTLLALSDDSKRLVLVQKEDTWSIHSVRWLSRRCTSLVFSRSEDTLLVADKSGDVYSVSVKEPQQEPELQLGHLSMVLDVTVSQDDRYIVTCDRDEKIRVSLSHSPYNIQSFCLGHSQFVSALLTPSGRPQTLLSGSGDGTVRVWNMESGQSLQTVELREHLSSKEEHLSTTEEHVSTTEEHVSTTETQEQRLTVNRLGSSPDGRHVAVQCDRLKQILVLSLDQDQGRAVLVPHSCLSLTHCPLDLTFDPCGRLWVLLEHAERPLQVYRLTQSCWEQMDPQSPELSRVSRTFQTFWNSVDDSRRRSSRLEHLYVETYDNVSEYMKKKQQRLEQQKKRSREPAREQSQAKKTKAQTQSHANGS